MARWLIAASIALPALFAGAVWLRAVSGPNAYTTAVYLGAARICHQRPERSFQTSGVQWPVCGRCSGLYLGGGLGGLLAASLMRRRVRPRRLRPWIIACAVPTVLTIVLEWTAVGSVGNLTRALAALPLGSAIALAIVLTAADESSKSNRVN